MAVVNDASTPDPTQGVAQIPDLRRYAFIEEADPLFFKAQRGEIPIEQWTAKVDEIRLRYPYL